MASSCVKIHVAQRAPLAAARKHQSALRSGCRIQGLQARCARRDSFVFR